MQLTAWRLFDDPWVAFCNLSSCVQRRERQEVVLLTSDSGLLNQVLQKRQGFRRLPVGRRPQSEPGCHEFTRNKQRNPSILAPIQPQLQSVPVLRERVEPPAIGSSGVKPPFSSRVDFVPP